MNINWYSFFHKIRTLSIISLVLSLLSTAFNVFLNIGGQTNMFGIGPYDSVPWAAISFLAMAFSWMLVIKYEHLRDVPDVTTKKQSKLYGTIAIILISVSVLAYLIVPQILAYNYFSIVIFI